MDWKTRIRAALHPASLDEDVAEELAQHAAATYASARAEGCEPADAERRVDREIEAWRADGALLRRRPKREPAVVPPAATASLLGSTLQDARYAWRLLRRQPGYAALVALQKQEEQLPPAARADMHTRSEEAAVKFAQAFPNIRRALAC